MDISSVKGSGSSVEDTAVGDAGRGHLSVFGHAFGPISPSVRHNLSESDKPLNPCSCPSPCQAMCMGTGHNLSCPPPCSCAPSTQPLLCQLQSVLLHPGHTVSKGREGRCSRACLSFSSPGLLCAAVGAVGAAPWMNHHHRARPCPLHTAHNPNKQSGAQHLLLLLLLVGQRQGGV